MSNNYDKFLKRMSDYRMKMNLTQEEISQSVGVTQSQYSKMELGKTIFPYEILQMLNKLNWNIDELLVGNLSDDIQEDMLHILQYRDEAYWKELLQAVLWALKLGIKKSSIKVDYEIQSALGILNLQIEQEKENTIMLEIRNNLGLSQFGMAEKLGVNIKKYRMLEKEQIHPDAELLIRIYEITGCRPGLFLAEEDVDKKILNNLFQQIKPELQIQIRQYLEQVIHLLYE